MMHLVVAILIAFCLFQFFTGMFGLGVCLVETGSKGAGIFILALTVILGLFVFL